MIGDNDFKGDHEFIASLRKLASSCNAVYVIVDELLAEHPIVEDVEAYGQVVKVILNNLHYLHQAVNAQIDNG